MTRINFVNTIESDDEAYQIIDMVCEKSIAALDDNRPQKITFDKNYELMLTLIYYRMQVEDSDRFDREVNRLKLKYPQLFLQQL